MPCTREISLTERVEFLTLKALSADMQLLLALLTKCPEVAHSVTLQRGAVLASGLVAGCAQGMGSAFKRLQSVDSRAVRASKAEGIKVRGGAQGVDRWASSRWRGVRGERRGCKVQFLGLGTRSLESVGGAEEVGGLAGGGGLLAGGLAGVGGNMGRMLHGAGMWCWSGHDGQEFHPCVSIHLLQGPVWRPHSTTSGPSLQVPTFLLHLEGILMSQSPA